MRKYLYREDLDEKDLDPLNAPRKTIVFHPNKSNLGKMLNQEQIKKEENHSKLTAENNSGSKMFSDDKVIDTATKRLFQDSFTAMEVYNEKKWS